MIEFFENNLISLFFTYCACMIIAGAAIGGLVWVNSVVFFRGTQGSGVGRLPPEARTAGEPDDFWVIIT